MRIRWSLPLIAGLLLANLSLAVFAPLQQGAQAAGLPRVTCQVAGSAARHLRCPTVRVIRPDRSPMTTQAVICAMRRLCAGGGGAGGGAWCQPVIVEITANDGNVGIAGWVSLYGTADCQAFRVYSVGFRHTYARATMWPWHWRVAWTADNGTYVTDSPLPTMTDQIRTPNYWVGAEGTIECFHAFDGWTSYDFALRIVP